MAKSRDKKDGGRVVTEIDLLEISATSTPAHPATRVLGWKSNGAFTDSEWERFRQTEAKAEAAHEQQRRDRELKKFIAEVEAKAQRKRSQPPHHREAV